MDQGHGGSHVQQLAALTEVSRQRSDGLLEEAVVLVHQTVQKDGVDLGPRQKAERNVHFTTILSWVPGQNNRPGLSLSYHYQSLGQHNIWGAAVKLGGQSCFRVFEWKRGPLRFKAIIYSDFR